MTIENVIFQFEKYLSEKGITEKKAIVVAAYGVLHDKPAKAGGVEWWVSEFKDTKTFVEQFVETANSLSVADKWATDYENRVAPKTVEEISALFVEYLAANEITDPAKIVEAAYDVLGGDLTPKAGGVAWWVGQKLTHEALAAEFIKVAGTLEQASKWADEFESGEGEPGEPSSLTEALDALVEARADINDFLEDARSNEMLQKNYGVNETTAVGTVRTNIGTEYTAATDNTPASGGLGDLLSITGFANRSEAVQNAAIAEGVSNAQAALDNAKAKLAKVPGLEKATATLISTEASYENALEAQTEAAAFALGAVTQATNLPGTATSVALVTAVNSATALNSLVVTASAQTLVDATIATTANTAVIILDTDGVVKVDPALTPAQKAEVKGLDDMIAALQAVVNSNVAAESAKTSLTEAANAVVQLESELVFKETGGPTADAILVEEGGSYYIYSASAASGAGEYYAATVAFEAGTTGKIEIAFNSDTAIASSIPTTTKEIDISKVNLADSQLFTVTSGKVTYTTNFEAAAKLADAVGDLEGVLNTLNEAIARFENAKELKDALDALDGIEKSADKALEDLGFDVVDLAATASGTSADDVFLMNMGTDSDITNFGKQGDDVLYLGDKEYVLVKLGANETINSRVGDANELEVFWKDIGGSVTLYVENETFAGNAAGSNATDDITQIKLVGVSGADLQLEDGFISIA